MNNKENWFPLQHDHSPHGERFRIPWRIAEKAYEIYSKRYGNSQSLDTIARRGGFSVLEIIMLLSDEKDVGEWQSNFFNEFSEENIKKHDNKII